MHGHTRAVRDLLKACRPVPLRDEQVPRRRDAYVAGLTKRAAPGARLLMFGYGPGALDDPFHVTADELRARFAGWQLADVTPGTNPFPTFWFTLRKPDRR